MKISGLNKWIIPRLFSIEDIVALCFFFFRLHDRHIRTYITTHAILYSYTNMSPNTCSLSQAIVVQFYTDG